MSNAVTSGLGWLTKLILWALVVVLAFMYLRAIPREGQETAAQAPAVPAGTVTLAAPSPTVSRPAPVAPVPAQPKPVAQPAPVQRAESATFANTLMPSQPAPVQKPKSAPAAEAKSVQPSPPVSKAPAVTAPAPAAPQAAAPSPAPQAPPAAAQPAPGTETIEQRRARVFAELQEMRRAAQEEMRKHRERMGVPGPMTPAPYGYPGYAPVPGYGPAPGYGQGPYAPR